MVSSPVDWSVAPMAFVVAPHCPRCGALRPIIVRSMPREADGSSSRRCVCRKCSRPFVLVIEPPREPEEPLPNFGRTDGAAW